MIRNEARRWVLEGTVIVLSILLAFAVDAFWEGRTERKAERVLLETLADDFEAIRELLPVHQLGHTRTAAALEHFVDLVRDANVGDIVSVPDTAIVLGIRNGSFDAPSGALDAVLSSGGLRLISDPELRRMLAAWPSRLLDATEDDRLLRELHGPELRRNLAEYTNLLGPLSRAPPNEFRLVTTSTNVRVTNELRGILPDVQGSSGLASKEEGQLILFVDSILVQLGR